MDIAADDSFRAALYEWIAERRARPLAFGAFDCCTLCEDYLGELAGRPGLMGALRGSYTSHAEAMAIIRRGGGLEKLVSARLGPMQPMARCEAGWIVTGDFGNGPALGICCGHNVAAVGERGLVFAALSRCEGCWAP